MDNVNRYVYEDIDEIPVFNFFKCCEGKYKYMYNDRKGDETEEVIKTFKNIYDKYCELTITNKTLKYYRLIGEIEWLEKKLMFVPILVNLLVKAPVEKKKLVIDEIKTWGFKIDLKKPLKEQLENIAQRLNNSTTKLQRKKDEVEEINGVEKGDVSLSKQVAKLKTILTGVSIDINKDSIATWVAYWDEVAAINNKGNE